MENASVFKEKVKKHLETIDGIEVRELSGATTEQMEFVFGPQFSDIHLKEAMRGVKTITKEAIRFGADAEKVSQILQILADDNEIVYAAANAIEEALPE